MSDKKKWKEMRAQLAKLGCEFENQTNTHYKVYHNGELVTVMQRSASCHRSWLNKRAELRRKGFAL